MGAGLVAPLAFPTAEPVYCVVAYSDTQHHLGFCLEWNYSLGDRCGFVGLQGSRLVFDHSHLFHLILVLLILYFLSICVGGVVYGAGGAIFCATRNTVRKLCSPKEAHLEYSIPIIPNSATKMGSPLSVPLIDSSAVGKGVVDSPVFGPSPLPFIAEYFYGFFES